VVDPLFYGLQIQEPSKFGSLGKPFDDLSKDILRGRKSLSELDGAVATWKKNGGDELREFYAGFLKA
jgi:putative aldouronate transport system substrate-binding protein